MTAPEPTEVTPVRFTERARQHLLSASYGLPGEHTVEFRRDDKGDDFAIITPGYPDDAPARLVVARTRAGGLAVTDCLSGRTLTAPTLVAGISLMGRMVDLERA